MSPKHQSQSHSQMSEHSPWTEAFQQSPLHQAGSYDTAPAHDDSLEPTWHALSAIYDPTER